MRSMLSALTLLVLSAPALAQTQPNQVPEPETLALLAVAVIGAIVAKARKRK